MLYGLADEFPPEFTRAVDVMDTAMSRSVLRLTPDGMRRGELSATTWSYMASRRRKPKVNWVCVR